MVQVQHFLKGNSSHNPKQHHSKQNQIVGLLYCGNYGGAMVLTHTKKKNKLYYYSAYIKGTKQTLSICPVQRIPADILQKAVLDQLGELLQSPTNISTMVKMDNSITTPKFRSAWFCNT